jgi:hypothetical protein
MIDRSESGSPALEGLGHLYTVPSYIGSRATDRGSGYLGSKTLTAVTSRPFIPRVVAVSKYMGRSQSGCPTLFTVVTFAVIKFLSLQRCSEYAEEITILVISGSASRFGQHGGLLGAEVDLHENETTCRPFHEGSAGLALGRPWGSNRPVANRPWGSGGEMSGEPCRSLGWTATGPTLP